MAHLLHLRHKVTCPTEFILDIQVRFAQEATSLLDVSEYAWATGQPTGSTSFSQFVITWATSRS